MSNMPELFNELIQKGFLAQSDILSAEDGFCLANRQLPQVGGGWLYAVPARDGYVYGVVTMSDQNGVEPGVVVSFASIDPETMHPNTLSDKTIKAYFRRTQAQGAYLIARAYVAYIAQERHIQLPYYYELYRKSERNGISRFIEINNEDAVHTVSDQETIYIRDLENISGFEKLAILATHTGCTSVHSFAAGVQYHARAFCKDAAAKLSIAQGQQPYQAADSKWVKGQKKHHKNV